MVGLKATELATEIPENGFYFRCLTSAPINFFGPSVLRTATITKPVSFAGRSTNTTGKACNACGGRTWAALL